MSPGSIALRKAQLTACSPCAACRRTSCPVAGPSALRMSKAPKVIMWRKPSSNSSSLKRPAQGPTASPSRLRTRMIESATRASTPGWHRPPGEPLTRLVGSGHSKNRECRQAGLPVRARGGSMERRRSCRCGLQEDKHWLSHTGGWLQPRRAMPLVLDFQPSLCGSGDQPCRPSSVARHLCTRRPCGRLVQTISWTIRALEKALALLVGGFGPSSTSAKFAMWQKVELDRHAEGHFRAASDDDRQMGAAVDGELSRPLSLLNREVGFLMMSRRPRHCTISPSVPAFGPRNSRNGASVSLISQPE